MAGSPEAAARRYFDCLDAEDWVGMREIWTDDGELRAVGARPRSGIDDVIGYFSKLFTPWAEHRDAPTRVIVSGDTVVAEVTFTGTTRDGRTVSFDAVDVFDTRDGRIRRLSNWYDIAYARKVIAPQ
jgi:ketosteroid isomerase-like protein